MCKDGNNKDTNKYIEIARKHGLETGSRAFGGYTEISDEDYVMLLDDYRQLCRIHKLEITMNGSDFDRKWLKSVENGYYTETTLRFRTALDNVNLILVRNNEEYKAWEFATNICKGLPEFLMAERGLRIRIFVVAKEQYRKEHNNGTNTTT